MSSYVETFKTMFKDRGQSITQPRLAVFRALIGQEPIGMHELIDQLSNIDRASIYRTVDLFEKLGIAHRVYSGWKYKLELTDSFHGHHHHLTCTDCGAIIDMNERELEQVISRLAASHNFKPSSHQIEIQGLCSKCQNIAPTHTSPKQSVHAR